MWVLAAGPGGGALLGVSLLYFFYVKDKRFATSRCFLETLRSLHAALTRLRLLCELGALSTSTSKEGMSSLSVCIILLQVSALVDLRVEPSLNRSLIES
jgi:hypothetical protein